MKQKKQNEEFKQHERIKETLAKKIKKQDEHDDEKRKNRERQMQDN